ncbi:MAG: hypothetical protein KDE31_10210 [Caldilineaceae bacterium]|nr:hypothetical protein [Caldilineaceae bacterium]
MFATPSTALRDVSASAAMLVEIASAPRAASTVFLAISLVTMLCSSIAATIVDCISALRSITPLIITIASTADCVSAWIDPTLPRISSVAVDVCLARSLTSPATTAKPFPASPARAASIVAFSASRLVCSAIELITSTTLPISADESPRARTMPVTCADSSTASALTFWTSVVLIVISLIEAVICSIATATEPTRCDTSSLLLATELARADDSSARWSIRVPVSVRPVIASSSSCTPDESGRLIVRPNTSARPLAAAIARSPAREYVMTAPMNSSFTSSIHVPVPITQPHGSKPIT